MANTEDKLIANWEVFTGLVSKISDAKLKKALTALCEENAERIMTCPASTRTGFIAPFAGGLVWHSLNVLRTMKELNKLYKANCSTNTLIVTSLFHDIGKIGNKDEEYYQANEEWFRKKGMFFKLNPEITSGVQTRSVWWLNSVGAVLSEDEMGAILSLGNLSTMYSGDLYNVSLTTMMLQQSARASCVQHKGITDLSEV